MTKDILRYFGLSLIKIEATGGGGDSQHQNMMSMLGINDAESFKSQIWQQREIVINQKHGCANSSLVNVLPIQVVNNAQFLIDIKNELIEIKKVFEKNNS
jgi:hypothetical protein